MGDVDLVLPAMLLALVAAIDIGQLDSDDSQAFDLP